MSFLTDIATKDLRYEARYRTTIIDRYSEVRGSINNRPIFSELWQCYAWAAVLGFINDRRRPLESPINTSFDFSTIRNKGPLVHKALLCAAIAKSDEGIEVLRDPKAVITLIEEYANGGFDLIAETLDEKGLTFFDSFDNMLSEVMDRG